MPERGPGMRREQPKRIEQQEKDKREPRFRAGWQRKLALAGLLITGASASYEHFTEVADADSEKHQTLSPEDQQNLEAQRAKLVMAAKLLSQVRPTETVGAPQETEEDYEAKEQWFKLQTALQNAQVDLEQARTSRPRNGDYGSFQERVSQHPEAEKIFDTLFKQVQVEYTEDGIYARLDGTNGFDLTVTADTDPTTHEAVMNCALSDAAGDAAQPTALGDEWSQEGLENIVNRKLAAQIESSVAAATRREIAHRYPDYQEPEFKAPFPGLEDEADQEN
jgi:hypothetical protein